MAVRDGSWRPDKAFNQSDGIKVTMRSAANLTPNGLLRVPLRFQVPPINDLRRTFQYNWSTYDTLSAGQRSRPMGKQLLAVNFDTLLLDKLAANAATGVVVWDAKADPQRMVDELRFIAGLKGDGPAAPFRLTLTQSAVWDDPIISMVATITSIDVTQRNGEIGTEYLSLSFLEYGDLAVGKQRRTTKPSNKHKLQDGDTLHQLAKHYMSQPSAWRQIADANGITGVSAGSADELATWAKRHHKTSLVIPMAKITVGRGFIGMANAEAL